jgi:ABC-type amino acid transport system permease subunit
VLGALIIVGVAVSVFGNPRWGWPVFAQWFFTEPVLVGLGRTLLLTAVGTVLGSLLGTVWRWRAFPGRSCWRACHGAISGCSARCR